MMSLASTDISDYTNRTPILVARVSTSEQRENIDQQVEDLKREAKSLGFRKDPIVIKEQQSGSAADLKTLRKIRKVIKENPKKKFVVLVRDIARFARDATQALLALKEMTDDGVPLLPLDIKQIVLYKGTPESKLVFTVIAAVAEGGKVREATAAASKVQASRKRGLFSGVPQDSYNELTKGKPQMRRQVLALMPAVDAGIISNRKAALQVGLLPQKFKQIREELAEREQAGKLDEWLEVWDAIVEAENRRGVGSRKKFAKLRNKPRALHRVTVAYLQAPDDFPRPDTQGNPETATRGKDKATGTIEDAIENPDFYQPLK